MAVITGTQAADTLTETGAVDTIDGLAGDDTIILDSGQTSGTDVINGGAGSDRLLIHRQVGGVNLDTVPSVDLLRSGPVLTGYRAELRNIEHFTIYHVTGEVRDSVRLSGNDNGDDIYYFTATNNQNLQPGGYSEIDLGGGLNDLVSIDASGVVDYGIEISISGGGRRLLWVGSQVRLELTQVERLQVIGSALGDRITGLGGNDIVDGRNGNDTILGLAGDDRLVGGAGNDTLNGGEGNDVLNFTTGTDASDGGNGIDRLEIDSRGSAGAVSFSVASGPIYAGSITTAGGTVTYSGIENFTVYSNAGNYSDSVTTGDGEDVFHHYGINDLSYLMDTVDLGGGTNDLLVADFSAVADYVVSNRVHPSVAGHYLFEVGGNGKIDYTGVERIHFIGGAQNDGVTGLGGNDIIEGRAGSDTLVGGDGDDDIAGGVDANWIEGGDGDDIVRSVSLGLDTVMGGAGADTAIIDYSDQLLPVTNLSNFDFAFGNNADTRVVLVDVERIIIATGSGNDDIATLGGDDEIRTGAGTDSIDAGAGNDYLDGGSGADAMTGGDGDDVYIVGDSGDTTIEASGEGIDTVYTTLTTHALAANLENLIATSSGAHNLRGNAQGNIVTGEQGNDFLLLQDGGDDTASGLWGNDVVYFGAAYTSDDHADGGEGRDAFVLQGNYTVTLSGTSVTGFESVSLQSGANTQYGDIAGNFYDFDITTTNDLVPSGVQLIVNAQSLRVGEDFTFDGSAETDGKFLIYGGHGVDDLTGGAGVDVFFFEGDRWGTGDKVDGGGGRDALVISAGSGLAYIEFGADSLTSIESISVNALYATDPSQLPSYEFVLDNGNVAPGGTLIVNASSLANSSQTVGIDGSGVHDGNLILIGGAGTDVITAGDGADLLIGGGLSDALAGGAGADTFRYDSSSDSTTGARDLIADFETGIDKIDLSRIDANSSAAGNQAFTWIGSTAFAGTGASSAGQLRAYQDGGGYWHVEGDTNGDGGADFAILFQVGTAAPVQSDFLL